MADILFSTLQDGSKIKLGDDTLVFDGGFSAADVSVEPLPKGVQLSAGNTSILLKGWEVGNLNSAQITFLDGSELMVGDTLFALTNDKDANLLEPFLPGDENRDQLRGMGGEDVLSGGKGDDLIFGQGGDDFLYGQDDNDWLDGGDGKDFLDGGAGADILKGFEGRDLLVGGEGADILNGGDGGDTFQIFGNQSPNGEDLHDKVIQFLTKIDKFDLDEQGTEQNYAEDRLKTNSYADAVSKANEIFALNEGLKDYVFIAGKSTGWLFGELTDDAVIDVAIEIGNGNALDKLAFADII